jgi:hypothetical protein
MVEWKSEIDLHPNSNNPAREKFSGVVRHKEFPVFVRGVSPIKLIPGYHRNILA